MEAFSGNVAAAVFASGNWKDTTTRESAGCGRKGEQGGEKAEEAVSQRLVRAENTTRPKHMYEIQPSEKPSPRGLSGVNAVIKDPEKFPKPTEEQNRRAKPGIAREEINLVHGWVDRCSRSSR